MGSDAMVHGSISELSTMPAMGQSRRFGDVRASSALALKADIHHKARHVSKVPIRDFRNPIRAPPLTQLGHSHDYVCLNFCSNLAASMSVRNLGRGVVGCGLQLVCVSGFDLVTEGSSLAVGNGRMARRGGAALIGSSLDYHARKAGFLQLTMDQRGVVIAMRRASQKRGGSLGNTSASAFVTSFANTFSSMRSHTLNRKWPPGLRTRFASR